eukprot:scaffold12210_cov17-Tisochrysis_lutea.AAC.1
MQAAEVSNRVVFGAEKHNGDNARVTVSHSLLAQRSKRNAGTETHMVVRADSATDTLAEWQQACPPAKIVCSTVCSDRHVRLNPALFLPLRLLAAAQHGLLNKRTNPSMLHVST